MQLQAKLIQILPLQTGKSKNGEWKKQDIIVETDDQYPKKVCISIWGDKVNTSILELENQYNFSINVESREYNGKWYTDVKAWKIETVGNANEPNQTDGPSMNDMPSDDFGSEPTGEDLPF